MKITRFYLVGYIYIFILCILIISCKDDDLNIIDNNNDLVSSDNIEELLDNVLVEWGISDEQIVTYTNSFCQLYNSDKNILQFKADEIDEYISYGLHDRKLCNTTILLPALSSDFKLDKILTKYNFVGELNNCIVYENSKENTIAMVLLYADNDSLFSAIGFSPIQSDSYEKVLPIELNTEDEISADMFNATLSGCISGVTTEVNVGFVYGTDVNISETNGNKIETTSSNNFTITIKGLVPDTTYYYYAYAIVDGLYYQGEIKSFKTLPFTYNIDGQLYKMIKVEGLSISPFYIMETELPPNSDFIVGENNIGKLNVKEDGAIFKSEFRNFLDKLRGATGLQFRLPTKEEWMFAASGGSKSLGYMFSGSNNIDDVAWYKSNCTGVQKIATKRPNELGLYDMSGNYAELCNDLDDLYYVDGVICGGSWKDLPENCNVSSWKEGATTGIIPGTTSVEKNAYDASYITIRLVYSIPSEK